MRRSRPAKSLKRNGTWYLIKRVPKEFTELDRRGLVRISTGIAVADDPRAVRATDVVRQLANELDAYWRGLRDGQSGEARLRFEAAQKRARALGLVYLTNAEIADGSRDDLIRRLELLIKNNSLEEAGEVSAVMGGEKKPSLQLGDLVDEYKALEAQNLGQMSLNQVKKWENPKKRAIANLIEALGGDKSIADLTRSDAVSFRQWWQKRIAAEKLDIGTANKDIGHISKMLTAVELAHQFGLPPVFKQLRLSGALDAQRAAFEAQFIQDTILADGALATLNEEARRIAYLMADTGLRLSEAANLLPEHILLDHEVPHVQIRAVGRKLKTDHSARDIPLVGVALAAMKLQPNGFPRYRDKAASLSAIVNKVMGNRKMLPTDDHSLYSLRHTFEDRLTAVEAPEKVIASLMGHKWIRPKYGAGPTLEQKQRWMLAIAFNPPKHL